MNTPNGGSLLPHSQSLARHFVDKPEQLEDIAALCEHLFAEIQTDNQARQALEWMALRLPVGGAMAQESNCSELALECAARLEKLVFSLGQRVDLSLPIQDPQVQEGLRDDHSSLGSVLLTLGHPVEINQLTLDPAQIPKMARAAVDHGKFQRAVQLLSLVSGQQQKDLNETIWMAACRVRDVTLLEGCEKLPDPPPNWWQDIHSNSVSLYGDRVAQRVLLDRPHLLVEYVGGVLTHGALQNIHPAMLAKACEERDQWSSNEGWCGSALEVLASRAGNEGIPWPRNIWEMASGAAAAYKMPESGRLPSAYIMRLLGATVAQEQSIQLASDFSDTLTVAGTKKPKQSLEEIGAHWANYPRGPDGEISAGLCALTGRAISKWSTSKTAHVKRLLEMARVAYAHPGTLQAIEQNNQDAIETQARSIKLLFAKGPTLDTGVLSGASQETKNDCLEYLLWNFASDRLGRRAEDHKKKIHLTGLSPRQASAAKQIAQLLTDGALPSWSNEVGKIGLCLLSNQFVELPESEFASLQHGLLAQTTTIKPGRPRARL